MGTLLSVTGIFFLIITLVIIYSICKINSPYSREEEEREIKYLLSIGRVTNE